MTDRRAVLVIAVVAAALTYGGLVGAESLLLGDRSEPTTAPTGEVAVQGATYHLDRTGHPTLVGEVGNGVGDPVTNVSVTVTFFRDGERVGRETGPVLRPAIPPGERAPFDVHLGDAAAADDYDVAVSYDRGGEVVDGLAVVDSAIAHRSQDQVTVTGTVENTADRPLAVERVVGTFYDRNGSTIGARAVQPTPSRLAPGERVSVQVTFRTLGDVPSLARRFDDFELDAVATRAE